MFLRWPLDDLADHPLELGPAVGHLAEIWDPFRPDNLIRRVRPTKTPLMPDSKPSMRAANELTKKSNNT